MKKQLIFFALTFVLTACMPGADHHCAIDYEILNQTETEIAVRIGAILTNIKPGEKQTVYETGGLCGKEGSWGESYTEEEQIDYVNVYIDGKAMPDAIWKRKYWEFTYDSRHKDVYTLTYSKELIDAVKLDGTSR